MLLLLFGGHAGIPTILLLFGGSALEFLQLSLLFGGGIPIGIPI